MKQTNIIQLLKCLSKEEIREFGKFVNSSFHNNRKDVIRFFDLIKAYYPSFDEKYMNNKTLFGQLYPDRSYKEDVTMRLSSHLYNLGKDYLTIRNLRNDKYFSKYHLLKSLDEHKADEIFEREFKNSEDSLNNEKLDDNLLIRKTLLHEINTGFQMNRSANRENMFKWSQALPQSGEDWINCFIVKLIVGYSNMKSVEESFGNKYNNTTAYRFVETVRVKEFLEHPEAKNSKSYNYLLFYYYWLMSIYEPENEIHYTHLKEQLLTHTEELSNSEIWSYFSYLSYYCMKKFKKGSLKFVNELFDLYKFELESHLPLEQFGGSFETFFMNFVITGLYAKEYDYIEKFISEYGRKLGEESGQDVLWLTQAMLNVVRKEYIRALDCLRNVKTSFLFSRISLKTLYVEIYYEMNEYESFFSQVDAFKHFVNNSKDLTDVMKQYLQIFLNYASKLAKMKNSGNIDDLSLIGTEIRENRDLHIMHKPWLMEKAEELGKMQRSTRLPGLSVN